MYRYRSHDGLDGEEGTFLLCTFWLAQALAKTGQAARARIVFERAAAFVNDVGLLAEEVDPVSGELLGNFPQAFSHIGLVNAAWAISEAEQTRKSPAEDFLGTSLSGSNSGLMTAKSEARMSSPAGVRFLQTACHPDHLGQAHRSGYGVRR